MNEVIDQLVQAGVFESVPPDPTTARRWLDEARRHTEAAALIADIDASGSYVLCYDAARKAIAAVLLAAGYRSMAAPGAHAAIADAAVSMTSNASEKARFRSFDRMRRQRNKSEYGLRAFSVLEVNVATELAKWIIEFADARLDR